MRTELSDIQLIEQYLEKKLDTQQLNNFLQKMKTDSTFKADVELQADILSRVQKASVMDKIETARQAFHAKQKDIKLRKKYLKLFSFAAAITAIIISFLHLRPKPDKTIISTKAKETNIPISSKQSSDSVVLSKMDNSANFMETNNIKGADWVNYCENHKKESQFFTVDPSMDTILYGREGTIIEVPSFCFSSADGDLIESKVTLELKEYYTMSDFIINSLTTSTHDKDILESGGMLYLNASSASKENLVLNEEIRLNFPSGQKENMQTYYGTMKDSNLTWQKDSMFGHKPFWFTTLCDSNSCSLVNKVDARSPINVWLANLIFKTTKTIIPYHFNMNSKVYVSNITPGSTIFIGGKIYYIDGVEFPGLEVLINLNSTQEKYGILKDSLTLLRDKNRELMGAKELFCQNETKILSDIREFNRFNSLFIHQLGYINCDRLLKEGPPKATLQVVDKEAYNILVFLNQKTLIKADKTGNFTNIPIGENVMVYGVKNGVNGFEFAFKEFIVKENSFLELEFTPMTIKDLNEKLEYIDNYKKVVN